MKEVQNKAKLSKQPKAFQIHRTLSVQTHECFQTQCTGQNKIVWERREGKAWGRGALLGQWTQATRIYVALSIDKLFLGGKVLIILPFYEKEMRQREVSAFSWGP